jgi:hypothetical protein
MSHPADQDQTSAIRAESSRTDASAVICDDVTCVACGYNLRGLADDGKCPECATPIARSIGGNSLRNADRDWLKSVHRGAGLVYWSCVLPLLLMIGIFFVTIAWSVSGVRHAVPGLIDGMAKAASAFVLLSPVLLLIGVVLMTKQEPRITHTEDGFTSRRLARFLSGILVAVVVAERLLLATVLTKRLELVDLFTVIRSVELVVAATTVWYVLRYVASLFRREDEDKNAKRSVTLARRVLASALIIAFCSLSTIGAARWIAQASSFVRVLKGLATLFLMFAVLQTIDHIGRLRKTTRSCLRTARTSCTSRSEHA